MVISVPETITETYDADCLILYRDSESRLPRRLLIELVAHLRRAGYRVVLSGFNNEARALELLENRGRVRCCLLQTNFENVSVKLLAQIKNVADSLVIDGVSVTGIDADVIGTNWREALSIGYRKLVSQGHTRISFLTSSHGARQIAMARREFLLLSEWQGPGPCPLLCQVDRLPGSYQREDLLAALPNRNNGEGAATALIIWGLVDGYLLDSALNENNLRLGDDISILLLGSVDVASEHVTRFNMVGNSDAEKLQLFERTIISRIEGDTSVTQTHYLPIYLLDHGSIQLLDATTGA
ncbi:hypothetical protein RC74_20625 [Falsihalocynthiibacter arcticus]|uniref:LacI family transcriptional regulator n=2 Tax=Falsihalocynthiibacter arcticus TaxID=1579316 RepID=A0A126V4U4_9RHOB|nr:hypothetical protein RC74_20625 [Falsihalocynthiibacter arcticus]